MNDKRRKLISEARGLIEHGKGLIEIALDDEQECFNNLPVGVQESDRGYTMEENIDNLQNAAESLGEAMDFIDEIE